MLSTPQQLERPLPKVDAATTAAMLSAAADLTLLIGRDDRVRDVIHNLRDLPAARSDAWRGRAIGDIVRRESQSALKDMLMSARGGKAARRFEISHQDEGERDLPFQYSALSAGDDGDLVLVGRDLRPVAELQARLLSSRQSLEENGRRQKQMEAHYRLLFETANEAILIVDPETGKIREANPRAMAMLGGGNNTPNLAGKRLSSLFDKAQQAEVTALLANVLAGGAPATIAVTPSSAGSPVSLGAELFRAGDLKLALIRLAQSGNVTVSDQDEGLGDLVRNANEAVLLADAEGRVTWVNEAFLALASMPLAAHATGKRLESFFDWQGIDQDVLLANVRTQGRVPLLHGRVRGANGQSTEVELSAVARPNSPQPGYAFVMRARSAEEARPARSADDLVRTAENLVGMIGRVPMKDMVRDTTDVIERMCIEAALKLSLNNRALTARVLGLSRQALYLKMRRFGIDDGE